MIRPRTRDAGFHHTNIELMIVVAIIAIIAAIAIPQYVKYRDGRAMTCLNNLLALADGKQPEKKTCPASDNAYATGSGIAECPSPANHLESAPRFLRTSTGSWSLKQTFPASDQPIALRGSRLEVNESPGRVAVLAHDRRPRRPGPVHPGALVEERFRGRRALLLHVRLRSRCFLSFASDAVEPGVDPRAGGRQGHPRRVSVRSAEVWPAGSTGPWSDPS